MRTVSVVSQKGGAGKTTLAIHIAAIAAEGGYVPIIIDLDPQATAAAWGDWRKGKPPEVITTPHTRLTETLAKAEKLGAHIAVIDTPPNADAAAVAAVKASDLTLIPCRPQAFDLHATKTTADLANLTRKPVSLVFNAFNPQAKTLLADAADIIRECGLSIAPVSISERAAYKLATGQGRTVMELEPIGKAALEIEALWKWICGQVDINTEAKENAA